MARFTSWKLPVTLLVLLIGLTPLFLPPGSARAGPWAALETITCRGHVYVSGSRVPIVGVTVQLWTARTASGVYHLAVTTQTGVDGAFEFKHNYAVRTDYEIRETNPSGYASTGAIAPGALVITDDTVRYVCRKCGWRWSRKIRVRLTPEITELAKAGIVLSRPISVPEGLCCLQFSE